MVAMHGAAMSRKSIRQKPTRGEYARLSASRSPSELSGDEPIE